MKKLLSIMLTVAIICSFFAMPVWAAGDVYVADFDFATSNKSSTGINLASGRSPHPYITGNILNGAAACGWIEETINVTVEGIYTPTLTWWANGESYRNFYPWIYVDGVLIWSNIISDNTSHVGHPENIASYLADAMLSSFNPCYLSEGEHTIRLLCGNGYPTVDKITFAKTETTKVTAFADAAGFDNVKSSGVTLGLGNGGYVASVQAGGKVCVEVIVPEAGTYNVGAVLDKSNGSVNVAVSANGTQAADEVVGISGAGYRTVPLSGQLELNKGKNELVIEVTGASLSFDGVMLEKLDEFGVKRVVAGNGADVDGSTVKRGMDFFEIAFNYALKADATTENVILFKTEDGEPVYVAIELETNIDTVTVKLKETLDFETDYVLTISGVKDEYGRELADTELTFDTCAADDDAGDGAIIINESETVIEGNTATVKGVVKSGAGIGIAGRCVQVTATSPTGQDVYNSQTVLTAEDGAFLITFEMNEDGESGEYTFVVCDEYVSAEPFKKLYVSNEAKTAIMDGLLYSEKTGDVDAVFEDYGFALGIDYPDDLSVLEDEDEELFLNHFVGAEFDSVDDVRAEYDLWLMFETLNQTHTGGKVQQILASEENCTALGLDKTAIDLIKGFGIYFCEAVAAIPAQESLDDFKAEFEVVLNDYFAVEMGQLDAVLDVDDVSGKSGQGVKLEIAFDEKRPFVSGIILDITADSVDLENVDISLELDGTYSTKKTDDGISLEIKADEALIVKDIATLIVTVPSKSGKHNITLGGTVAYLYDNDGYSRVYTNGITKKDVVLTAKAASTNGGGGGGGNSSSRPAGGSVAGSPINIGASAPVVDTKFEFADLANAQWAKESINALLEKGVISESTDKKFNPDRNVTREEFVKMIVVAMGVFDKNAVSSLVDVDGNEWYAPYIASAEKAGLITGDENGNFGVGEEISRQDMAVIIYRAMADSAKQGNSSGFADDGEIADYAKTAVYSLAEMGIVNGVGDNMFAPFGAATRAMAAKVIYGMIGGLK